MSTVAGSGSEGVPPVLGLQASAKSLARFVGWGTVTAVMVFGVGVLFWFDPSRHSFFPKCLFHEATGLLCPGCGSLRSLHQLLHGNFAAALRFNPLLVLSVPAIAGMLTWRICRRPGTKFIVSPRWILIGLAVLLVFTIWRNLAASASLPH